MPHLRPKAKTLMRLQQMLQSATAIIWLLGPSSTRICFGFNEFMWLGKGGRKSSGHLSAAAQVFWRKSSCCHGDSARRVVLGCLPSCTGLELTEKEGKEVAMSGAQEVRTVLGETHCSERQEGETNTPAHFLEQKENRDVKARYWGRKQQCGFYSLIGKPWSQSLLEVLGRRAQVPSG